MNNLFSKSAFLVVVALVVVPAGAWGKAAGKTAAPPLFDYPVQKAILDNGLTILTVPFDAPGTMSYYTIEKTGSRNEVEKGLSGFAHFFEHMMFRGTPQYSTEKYNSALKQFGADSNAFTSDDWTVYHVTASAGALETVMEMEADRFQNLSYDEPSFQKEARAVLGEYNKIASSPMLLLDEKLQDTAYTRHTYKHTTIGFLKDIVDMPNQYQYSLKFFERWYRPDNCFVLVVGDVKHAHVIQLAKRHYSNWKAGVAKVDIPVEPPQTAERRVDLTWKGATLPHLYIGYHVPAFDPDNSDVVAIDVLAEAMFSTTSDLYRQLVLEQAKVEEISGGAPFRRDPGLFTVLMRVRSAADLVYVENLIHEALDRAAEQPLSAQRLTDIKSHLRYGLTLDSTDAVALALGNFLKLTGNPDSLNQTYANYEKVTAADVQRVAKKYFAKSNRTVVTLVSASDKAGTQAAAAAPQTPSPSKLAETPKASLAKKNHTRAEFAARLARKPDRLSGRGQSSRKPKSAARTADVLQIPSKSPSVSLRIMFNVGSQNDPPGKEGLAALTARLIQEGGTLRLSYRELLEKLYPLSGSIEANCDKEATVFVGDVHRDKVEAFYTLFADMLLKPRMDPADFERLRAEQVSYLSAGLRGNDDENLGKWTLQVMLYGREHPYGHVDAGTVAGLKSITLDDVRKFHREHYTLANMRAGMAGNVDGQFAERLRSDLAQQLAAGKSSQPTLPQPKAPEGLAITIVEKPTIATAISLGFPVDVARGDDDFYPLFVANSALGEHRTFNGRLMVNMRGKRGLNYGDYSYAENFIQDGSGVSRFAQPNVPRRQQYFSIWIRPVPHDKAAFALRQALRELDQFVKHGLTQDEFEATRNFLFHYSKLWVQTPSRRLGYELDGAFYGREDLVEELQKRLPSMTLDDVNRAIRKHLQSNNVAVGMVTENAGHLRDTLMSGNATPLVYDTEGTPPEVVAEDREIAAWPLPLSADKVRIVPVAEMFEKK